MPVTKSKYEFDQLIAEAAAKLGQEIVFKHLDACAREYGWPIPEQHWDQVILPLALRLRHESN